MFKDKNISSFLTRWSISHSSQDMSWGSLLTSRAWGRCWPGGRRRRRRVPPRSWPHRCTCPGPPEPPPWSCEHRAGPGCWGSATRDRWGSVLERALLYKYTILGSGEKDKRKLGQDNWSWRWFKLKEGRLNSSINTIQLTLIKKWIFTRKLCYRFPNWNWPRLQ